jgi:hypothetical protein
MSMAAQIAAESRRGRLLFPLKPIEQESFQGYIVRLAEWNAFGSPKELMKALGLVSPPSQHWRSGLQTRNDDFVWRLGVGRGVFDKMLLWSDPERGSYDQRVGRGRRVSPSGLRTQNYHREYWCLSQLPFCPEGWDALLTACPACQSDLDWSCLQVDHCGRCAFDLKQAETASVPTKLRPPLAFMAGLLNRDRATREAARQQAPAEFRSISPFMIFDLAALFGRAADSDRGGGVYGGSRLHTEGYPPAALAEGARIVLDYPASFCRLAERRPNSATSDFFANLRQLGRLLAPVGHQLTELVNNWEPIAHGPSRLKHNREEQGQWTLREVAEYLGVQNSQVRSLVEADLIVASPSRGAKRTCQWFAPEEAERIGAILADRISLAALSQTLGLSAPGIEQLVASGLLRLNENAVVGALHSGPQFRRTEALKLLDDLRAIACEPASADIKMFTLEDVFRGIGAQPKPWEAVISAILAGGIAAYSNEPQADQFRIKHLRVGEEFTREFVAGRWPKLLLAPGLPVGADVSRAFSRSDAECHLNCYPRDLTWLRTGGHLPLYTDPSFRGAVEALGRELISSREMMWRWRVSPALRESLPTEHGIARSKGPFWPRKAIEDHFRRMFCRAAPTELCSRSA